jgi:hypothetical protein
VDVKKLGILFLLCVPIGGAQNKPETTPVISLEDHTKIRDLQRQMDKLVITSLQLQRQQEDLQKQYASASAQLEDAVTKAMVDAKADGKDWSLDRENLTFKAVPKPEPKPDEKKKP